MLQAAMARGLAALLAAVLETRVINDRDLTLSQLVRIHYDMKLPEPIVWVHREDGMIAGLIEGWIQNGVAAVDHMIVLPTAKRKFHVMMTMSRACTKVLHSRGFDVVIKIGHEERVHRPGLVAWATRCGYTEYHFDGAWHWYINRKEVPANGQVVTPQRSEAPASAA
jgi:hypothetical protein